MQFRAEGFAAYFPNLIFTLVRSARARRPNEFVFRVPAFVNKFDIHQYLSKLYGLDIVDIRTTNFVARKSRFRSIDYPAKKTAVVTVREELDEDGNARPIFRYPDPPSDLNPDNRDRLSLPVRFPKYK